MQRAIGATLSRQCVNLRKRSLQVLLNRLRVLLVRAINRSLRTQPKMGPQSADPAVAQFHSEPSFQQTPYDTERPKTKRELVLLRAIFRNRLMQPTHQLLVNLPWPSPRLPSRNASSPLLRYRVSHLNNLPISTPSRCAECRFSAWDTSTARAALLRRRRGPLRNEPPHGRTTGLTEWPSHRG